MPRNPSEMPLVPVMPVPVPVPVMPVRVPVPVPVPLPTPESNWDVAPVRPDRAPDAVVPSYCKFLASSPPDPRWLVEP